jgi:peptidoglycan/xylan/chitin deacetylase (PgdA/CDA1 family)
MYHDVSEASHEVPAGHRPYVIDPERFGIQMRSVGGQPHPTMNVRQWCALRPRQPAIVLTFDDGHVSNYENALPILVDCGLTATFFVTAGLIGTGNTMNWSQIRALHSAGMEIGSHTVTHRPPALLSDAELRDELLESRRILEDGLGTDVLSISSPTGFFNPRMRLVTVRSARAGLGSCAIRWIRSL